MDSAIVDVRVTTETTGELLVEWDIEGDPVAVDVALGASPDHVDHQHETTVDAGVTSVRVTRPGIGRHFVSVAPHGRGPALVAADRRVPFEGPSNFRDLGGYPTTSGRRTRWGVVFRADSLHELTADDLKLYEELGLRTVYDLRSDVERDERPNPIPSRAFTVISRSADEAGVTVPTDTWTTAVDGEQILHELYVRLIEHAAATVGALYTELAQPDGLPAVFHCHAGKDRTGIVAALLLELAGVDREVVLDDYELTSRYRLRSHQEATYRRLLDSGISAEAAAGVLAAPRWAMGKALEALDERFGGIEPYLTGPGGMKAAGIEVLRQRLVSSGG